VSEEELLRKKGKIFWLEASISLVLINMRSTF
jgi:hypothetical protein